MNSVEQEYSNYDSSLNDQNALLQKRYNEILAKRFPHSKSEETTAHQTPIRNIVRNRSKKKYSFHIPAHLKSKSKEFLAPQNIDGSKFNIEVLSHGKYGVKENQSYSNITKRRLLQNLKGKLSPSSNRIVNPRHATKANKERYIHDHNTSIHNRSDSLPNISREAGKAVSKASSKHNLSRINNLMSSVNYIK